MGIFIRWTWMARSQNSEYNQLYLNNYLHKSDHLFPITNQVKWIVYCYVASLPIMTDNNSIKIENDLSSYWHCGLKVDAAMYYVEMLHMWLCIHAHKMLHYSILANGYVCTNIVDLGLNFLVQPKDPDKSEYRAVNNATTVPTMSPLWCKPCVLCHVLLW